MNKDKHLSLDIFTKHYHSQVKKLESDLYLSNRTHHYRKHFDHTETFGPHWLLIFVDLHDNVAKMTYSETEMSLSGRIAIFVPEFCILNWKIPEGSFSWQCISSSAQTKYPKELLVFQWDEISIPASHLEIKSFLHSAHLLHCLNINSVSSKIALRTKQHIDLHYKSDLKIQDIAKELNYHRIHLSREFKNTFGLSMVEYRHQLRIYEALKQMNRGLSLTESIFLSGYSSMNQFISYFNRYFLIAPSYFNINKPKSKRLEPSL